MKFLLPIYIRPIFRLLRDTDLVQKGDRAGGQGWKLSCNAVEAAGREAKSTLFCPSHEKFHTVVFKGVRNISDTL